MLLGIWVGASACTQLYISRPDRISSPRCDWEDLGSFLIYTLSEGAVVAFNPSSSFALKTW